MLLHGQIARVKRYYCLRIVCGYNIYLFIVYNGEHRLIPLNSTNFFGDDPNYLKLGSFYALFPPGYLPLMGIDPRVSGFLFELVLHGDIGDVFRLVGGQVDVFGADLHGVTQIYLPQPVLANNFVDFLQTLC